MGRQFGLFKKLWTGEKTIDLTAHAVYLLSDDIDENSVTGPQAVKDVDNYWVRDDYFVPKVGNSLRRPDHLRRRALYDQLRSLGYSERSRYFNEYVFSPELCEIILEGRMKIALLINSPGGIVKQMQRIIENLEWIKTTGNEITAYVRGQASSAAARILEVADRRFALNQSQLMWHISSFKRNKHGEYPYVLNGQKRKHTRRAKKEMKQFRQFLERSVHTKYICGLMEEITCIERDENNIENAWSQSGAELEELGVLDKSFYDIEEMRIQFAKNFEGALEGVEFADNYFK